MELKLIGFIKSRTATPGWSNGKAGSFEYDPLNYGYRFVSTTKDLNCYLYAKRERNDENTPIVIKGFLSFLIACWGQDELVIYNTYNEKRKQQFFDVESKKPGSFKRNLEQEFAKYLLGIEQKNIECFQCEFDYISIEEKCLILEYGRNYLEYTASLYKQRLKEIKVEKTFESLLHHDNKVALMNTLHKLLDDTAGKDVAIVVKALCKLGYLNIPNNKNELYRIMEATFGKIGTASNLNVYLSPDSNKLLSVEIDPIVEILRII